MNKIDIHNSDKFELNESEIRQIVFDSLGSLGVDTTFTQITFVDDDEMKRLNLEHRHKDATTDVLSFPQAHVTNAPTRILGDIVISLDETTKKGETLEDVLKHGLLHLLGFDHEENQSEWNAEAKKIKAKY